MVSTKPKKVIKKVQRDRKKVDEPTAKFAEEAPIVESVKKPEPIILMATHETPSRPVDYQALLAEAPPVPYFSKMEDAVKFVDEYARWKSRVKAAA